MASRKLTRSADKRKAKKDLNGKPIKITKNPLEENQEATNNLLYSDMKRLKEAIHAARKKPWPSLQPNLSETTGQLSGLDEARLSKCREEAGGKWRRQRQRKDPPDYSTHFPRIGEPIDLSTKKLRGSPPSYSQTIAIQKQSRTTVITTSNYICSDGGGGVCDPMIDEHFRRSLGKDYLSSADEADTNDSSEKTDSSSLSVDDHFAKALGDNWLQLQRETEEKLKKNEKEDLRASDVST